MSFSVIIATLGRPHILKRTIDSIARCDPAPDELIVVDGDETRSSEIAVQGDHPFPVRYLTSERGLPKQRNAGIDAAEGEVLVFVDDDVEIPGNTFGVLRRVYGEASVAGATARIVEPATDRIGKKHSPARRALPGGGREGGFTRFGYPHRLVDLDTERDIEFMHGSFMSVRAGIAGQVRFDENLPGYALAEDEDFSYRVSRRGRIRFVPELHVIHAKEGHGSRDARAFGRTLVINRSYLFRKNFKRTLLARLQFGLLIALFMAHRLVNREWAELVGLAEGSIQALGRPLEKTRSRDGSDRLRVAFVSSHARSGGSEAYLTKLVELLPGGVVSEIVVLEHGPLVDALVEGGHDPRVIPASGGFSSIFRASRALRARLQGTEVDVVHANGVKAALACALARLGVPFVWVKHDFSFDGALTRWLAGRATAVVGVSDAVLASLTETQRQRAHVVHTGIEIASIDRSKARRRLAAELRADDRGPLVGIVGRMHPVKGHEDFVEVARRVLAERPETRFVFVGGEDDSFPEHAHRVRAAAAVLGDRAHFLGHRNDVAQVIAGLDVGVLTSHRNGAADVEALPLTALEMLALGTPVAAYGSGGIPELLGECGAVVPTGDREGLARAVIALVDDPDAARRSSDCGQRRTERDFTPTAMVDKMMSIYVTSAR